jgi:hypothetical protein
MEYGFVAVERFEPPQNYKDWSKLYHIIEIVSFDIMLCPRLFKGEESHAIWLGQHMVYDDLDYLLNKVANKTDYQILALVKDPEDDCSQWTPDERFRFYGYDLTGYNDDISSLTNCGVFDKAFLPSDISPYGLVEDFKKAKQIQAKLREEYPNVGEANCTLWAIWRMDS